MHVCSFMTDSLQPMDCGLPGSFVNRIFQQEYCSRLLFPTPGDLPYPRIKPASFVALALPGRFFTSLATREALSDIYVVVYLADFMCYHKYPWSIVLLLLMRN